MRFSATVVAVALACVALAAFFKWQSPGRASSPAPALPPPAPSTDFVVSSPNRPTPAVDLGANPARPLPAPPRPAPAPPPAAPVTGLSAELVASLISLNPSSGPLTPEKAAAWKQTLQSLVQQGATAIPAIREFLSKNTDVSFGADAAAALGYGSARAGLVDALAQIGGPEATTALFETLQTTADPRELAVLTQDLDKLAPDQFHEQAVQSARQLLQTLITNPDILGEKDAAPLFEVLAKYGGANVLSDLEAASGRWAYYAAIALAQLPGGVGVPALVQMMQPQGGAATPSDPALRMLAELATQYPEARDALMQQAKQNRIPYYSWAAIAPILAGDQVGFQYSAFDGTATSASNMNLQSTHLSAGNQNFYSAPSLSGLTPDQISQLTGLIQSLQAVTTDPAAIQALKNSSDLLTRRYSPPSPSPAAGP